MRRLFLAGAVAGTLFLAGCDLDVIADSERYTEDFHHTYPLKPGGRVAIENFNGSVEISGWSENSIQINGTKYAATREMLAGIKIDISAAADSISIRTIRPSVRRGNMGAKYYIKVPRQVELDRITSSNGAIRASDLEGPAHLKTTNGSVRGMNLHGDLDVQTTNGGIEVQVLEGSAVLKTTNGRIRADEIQGSVDATTSNGGIHVRMAKSSSGRPTRLQTTNGGVELALETPVQDNIEVSTSNGGITLRLPDKLGARVDATTSNSSITTDFDVQAQGEITKRRLQGTIGAGGPSIQLSTTNGSIRLLKL